MQLLTKMVHGFPHISSTNDVYEGCVLGKHHREMFEKGKAWCAKEPLQLIHSDIFGPLEVPYFRTIYFLTFIDDFSRKSWVYFLKNKSEVFSIFQIFKSLVENESGKKIKTLRSDNGGGGFLRMNWKHFYPNMVFNTKRLYLTHLNTMVLLKGKS